MFGEKINIKNLNSKNIADLYNFNEIKQDWHKRNDSEDIQAIIKAEDRSPNEMQKETTGEKNKKDLTYFQLRKKLRKQLQEILNED